MGWSLTARLNQPGADRGRVCDDGDNIADTAITREGGCGSAAVEKYFRGGAAPE